MPITTKVVSSNPAHAEVYSMQHYVIKHVSDLRQVGGFLQFPPTNLTDDHDITESGVKHRNSNPNHSLSTLSVLLFSSPILTIVLMYFGSKLHITAPVMLCRC